MNYREEQVYDLARMGFTRWTVRAILRDLPAIQRANEAECSWNEDVSYPFTKRGDEAFDRVARMIGASTGLLAIRQTDPRGACVEVFDTAKQGPGAEPLLRLGAPGFTTKQFERIDSFASRKAGAR